MSGWMGRISNDKEDASVVAKEWMEANHSIIESEWLAGIQR